MNIQWKKNISKIKFAFINEMEKFNNDLLYRLVSQMVIDKE